MGKIHTCIHVHTTFIVNIAGESECRVRANGEWTDMAYQSIVCDGAFRGCGLTDRWPRLTTDTIKN